jgi:hypothetical protein
MRVSQIILSPSSKQGPIPTVRIHRLSDLEFMGSVSPEAELDITALSFSSDGIRLAVCSSEPELSLGIYEWKQRELIVGTTLPLGSTATEVSFHPHNANLLCTTGDGPPLEWRMEKLWGKYEVSYAKIDVPEGVGAPTCHSWFPGGLYLGFSSGQVLAVDVQTSAPQQPESNSFSPPGSAPSGALRPGSKRDVAALGLAAAVSYPIHSSILVPSDASVAPACSMTLLAQAQREPQSSFLRLALRILQSLQSQ